MKLGTWSHITHDKEEAWRFRRTNNWIDEDWYFFMGGIAPIIFYVKFIWVYYYVYENFMLAINLFYNI